MTGQQQNNHCQKDAETQTVFLFLFCVKKYQDAGRGSAGVIHSIRYWSIIRNAAWCTAPAISRNGQWVEIGSRKLSAWSKSNTVEMFWSCFYSSLSINEQGINTMKKCFDKITQFWVWSGQLPWIKINLR